MAISSARARLSWLLRAAISFGLIALILWRADLSATFEALKQLQLWPFLGALASSAFAVVVRSYKWHLLLHVQGGSRPFGTSLRVMFMATFVNNFFLGTLGGDAYRAYHARDYSKSTGSAGAAVIMERATGLLSALLLVFVVGIFLSYDFVTPELLVAIGVVGLVGLTGLVAMALLGARTREIPGLARLERATRLVEDASNSLLAYRNHRVRLAVSLLLSLLFHTLQSVSLLLFAWAAGVSPPFATLLFIAPLTGILVVLPVSINGIGIKEGSLVFFLEQIGTPGPEALLIALMGRLGNMTISLIGGLLFLFERSERNKLAVPIG